MGIFGRKKQQPVRDEGAATSGADETLDSPSTQRRPKDRPEVDGLDGRLDLGAIWLRGVPGMELRLETDQDRQKVIGAHIKLGESQMQVQAFAAPKSSGIWDEIRDEIAQGLATAGGTAEEADGPLGTELHARMPSRGTKGQAEFLPVRFVGVDGPRWFFRAVMSGRAAIEEQAAEQLYALIEDIVIVRGEVPMAPRELLALTLPAQPQAEGADDDDSDSPDAGLNPFTRGPEITEIR